MLEIWGDSERIARPLALSVDLGLGYLALRQPAVSLSGGELQRLKLVHELGKKTTEASLYILDEPTVGQSESDVARLVDALDRLVEQGHTVLVIEHHAGLLAACDWLIELGPGAGAAGGRVVAAGTPEHVARRRTATAPYLREVLS